MSVPSFLAALTSPDIPPNAATDVAFDGFTAAPAMDGEMPVSAAPTLSAATLVSAARRRIFIRWFLSLGIWDWMLCGWDWMLCGWDWMLCGWID